MPAANFPQRGIQIAHVDDVTAGIANLNAVADAIRRAGQNINPTMKLEIGVCKANPRISEINPKETTAAYQFTNSTETTINAAITRRLIVEFALD